MTVYSDVPDAGKIHEVDRLLTSKAEDALEIIKAVVFKFSLKGFLCTTC